MCILPTSIPTEVAHAISYADPALSRSFRYMTSSGTCEAADGATMADTHDADRMTDAQRLDEIAGILAGAILRLRAKHAAGPKKREISRDNSLGCPAETRPPAVNF